MQKEKTYKLLLVSFLLVFIISFCCTSKVYAATFDLSDYANRDLVGEKWVIIYSIDNNRIYLLTLERADYPYIYTHRYNNPPEGKIYSTGGWVSNKGASYQYWNQGHVKYYTFNRETNQFENRQNRWC